MVLGNLWGGGQGSYEACQQLAGSKEKLDEQINAALKDGSLDGGMGFQSLVGTLMVIETIETRIIDGKTFIAKEYDTEFYGELTDEQQDHLEWSLDSQ